MSRTKLLRPAQTRPLLAASKARSDKVRELVLKAARHVAETRRPTIATTVAAGGNAFSDTAVRSKKRHNSALKEIQAEYDRNRGGSPVKADARTDLATPDLEVTGLGQAQGTERVQVEKVFEQLALAHARIDALSDEVITLRERCRTAEELLAMHRSQTADRLSERYAL